MLSNGIGNSLDDLKYNYTIDQIYLLYEKCRKAEMDAQRMNAIILAHSFMFATPAYDKTDANKKAKSWKKFMESLDWDRLTSNKNRVTKFTFGEIKKMFIGLGIPIDIKQPEEGEPK